MLAINVTLLHGTMRATSADDLSLTGHNDPGDWPPSPARLIAALVAADGTRDRCRVTSGAELSLFERGRPPRIFASSRSMVLASPLRPRYVVANARGKGSVQEYPARKAAEVRPGPRLAPRDRRVAYVWDDIEPTASELEALSARAARVGYLGCADSPAQVTVSSAFEPTSAPETVWEPHRDGDHDIPVPFPGFIDTLDRAFDQWATGKPVRRSWFRTEREPYRSPDQLTSPTPATAWQTVLWLRFDESLPGRAALRVTETLKAAVLELYQRHVAGSPDAVPAILHGHGFDRSHEYQLAQWLVLPDVGHLRSQGRLHGAAIMLPRGTDVSVVEGVRHSLWRLRQLAVPGLPPTRLHVHGGEKVPWAACPERWLGPSRGWKSVLPVVHERRRRHGPTLDDVALWCRHGGFPPPSDARVSPVPLLPGSPALQPEEIFRSERDGRRPYSHLELVFADKVSGPIVLGRARQFGMGLLAPVQPAGNGS